MQNKSKGIIEERINYSNFLNQRFHSHSLKLFGTRNIWTVRNFNFWKPRRTKFIRLNNSISFLLFHYWASKKKNESRNSFEKALITDNYKVHGRTHFLILGNNNDNNIRLLSYIFSATKTEFKKNSRYPFEFLGY